jgi:carbon storage regulator
MLVLTRKELESICIGDEIVVTVAEVRGGRVKLAIDAPRHVRIDRQEVSERTPVRRRTDVAKTLSDSREFKLAAG